MKRLAAAMALAALLLAAVPAHAAGDPASNAFGTVEIPAHPQAGPQPVDLPVRVTFDDPALLEETNQIMLAFDIPDPEHVTVTFQGIDTGDGRPVPISKDQRNHSSQPGVFVDAAELENHTALHVNATVATDANGRFPIGFMVIPFDDDWETLSLEDGTADLYGYAVIASDGHETDGLEPPLRGSGNDVPALGPLAVVSGLGLAATWRRSGCQDGARRP